MPSVWKSLTRLASPRVILAKMNREKSQTKRGRDGVVAGGGWRMTINRMISLNVFVCTFHKAVTILRQYKINFIGQHKYTKMPPQCVCGSLTGVHKQIPFRIMKFQTKFCLNIWLYNAADKSFSFPISQIIQIDIDSSSTAANLCARRQKHQIDRNSSLPTTTGEGKALRE